MNTPAQEKERRLLAGGAVEHVATFTNARAAQRALQTLLLSGVKAWILKDGKPWPESKP